MLRWLKHSSSSSLKRDLTIAVSIKIIATFLLYVFLFKPVTPPVVDADVISDVIFSMES